MYVTFTHFHAVVVVPTHRFGELVLNKVRKSIWKKPALLYNPQIPLLSNLAFAMPLIILCPYHHFVFKPWIPTSLHSYSSSSKDKLKCLYTCTHWSPELFSQYFPQLTDLSFTLNEIIYS